MRTYLDRVGMLVLVLFLSLSLVAVWALAAGAAIVLILAVAGYLPLARLAKWFADTDADRKARAEQRCVDATILAGNAQWRAHARRTKYAILVRSPHCRPRIESYTRTGMCYVHERDANDRLDGFAN